MTRALRLATRLVPAALVVGALVAVPAEARTKPNPPGHVHGVGNIAAGPIQRGDWETVDRHRRAIHDAKPEPS